jgi:uncharacterized protein (DUF1800 family)
VTAAIVCAAVTVAAPRSVTTVSRDDDRLIFHVLNRIGFGPRPGDAERVRAIGAQKYIAEQLHPEKLHDAAASARLAEFSTLTLSSREIAEKFEIPQLEARRERKAATDSQAGTRRTNEGVRPGPDSMQQRANLVFIELGEQKMLRAVYSERQLQEVLTDFWFNHFNVDARKGPARFMLTEYERDVIRPHVLGKFRDLLEAVAKSPAMLFYLDNWMSADPNGPHAEMRPPRIVRGPFGGRMIEPPRPRPQPQGKNAPKGLNENYGRELMELHTLGVDGGYTQKDVTEVARAFTGWTIDKPRQGGGFKFEPRIHDQGQKVVLGHVIKAGGGQNDGEQVLDLLARHPSTARFIATKLVRRFVSDTPPAALVDRAAARFVSHEAENAGRFRRQRVAGDGSRRAGRDAAGAIAAAVRDAVVHVPATHRIQGHGRRVGEHRRARFADELRPAACGQPVERRRRSAAGGRCAVAHRVDARR